MRLVAETARKEAAACVFVLSSLFSLIVRRFFFLFPRNDSVSSCNCTSDLLVTVWRQRGSINIFRLLPFFFFFFFFLLQEETQQIVYCCHIQNKWKHSGKNSAYEFFKRTEREGTGEFSFWRERSPKTKTKKKKKIAKLVPFHSFCSPVL